MTASKRTLLMTVHMDIPAPSSSGQITLQKGAHFTHDGRWRYPLSLLFRDISPCKRNTLYYDGQYRNPPSFVFRDISPCREEHTLLMMVNIEIPSLLFWDISPCKKRNILHSWWSAQKSLLVSLLCVGRECVFVGERQRKRERKREREREKAVSYTHLTLPTTAEV